MTAVPAALRAIQAAFTARLPAGTLITVGPGVTDDAALSGQVFIGCSDPDEKTYAEAVIGSQQWAFLGHTTRDETFTVHCSAVAWNGDTNALAAVDGVYALMGAIEAAIVADPTLGGALLYAVGITSHSLRFVVSQSGISAIVPFDFECRTRI